MTCNTHRQAAYVALFPTGEIVACICLKCHDQLPANFIAHQREDAMREAYCQHADTLDLESLAGYPHVERLCVGCGVVL